MDYPIVQYIGRFHPLLVHLPLGILVMAVLLGFLSRRESYSHLRGANHILLFFGAISATLASVTGYVLSLSGEYNADLTGWHQWSGLCLTGVSWVAFFVHSKKELAFRTVLILMGLLLVFTGHLGGSLTHGTDFLTPPPIAEWLHRKDDGSPLLQLNSKTIAYEAASNILTRKCKSCHGPSRQKGKLRLDAPEHIMAGGESGNILGTGEAGKSTILNRILLPAEDEDHMPPKEKSQLTEVEKKVLVAWIETGASFDQTIGELGWSDSLLFEFSSPELTSSFIGKYEYIPQEEIEEANELDLRKLEELGVILLPVSEDLHYLSASFIQVNSENVQDALNALVLIGSQCIELDLGGKPLQDIDVAPIAELGSLRKLNLSNCGLSDDQVSSIGSLSGLRYLNLVGNRLSLEGILQLRNLPHLKQLYLFQNNLSSEDQHKLRLVFSSTELDFGSYELPVLPGDTNVITF